MPLLYWLRELSKRRSVIIVVDDAQWADADSGRLLAQLLMPGSGFRGLLMIADQGKAVASPLVDSVLKALGGAENSAVCELGLQPLSKPCAQSCLRSGLARFVSNCLAKLLLI